MEKTEKGNEGQEDAIKTTSKNFPKEHDEDGKMGETGNRDRQQEDGNETKLVEDETKIIMTEQSIEEMDLSDVKSKNFDKEEEGETEKREEEKPDVSQQADMEKTKNGDRQQEGANETTSAEDETKITTTEQPAEEMKLSDVKSKSSYDKTEVGDTEKPDVEKPDVTEKVNEESRNDDPQQEDGNETKLTEHEKRMTMTEKFVGETDLNNTESTNSSSQAKVGATKELAEKKPDVLEKVDAEKTENDGQQGNENETTSVEDEREITMAKHLVRDTDLKEVKPTNSNTKAEVGDAEKLDKEKPGVSGKAQNNEAENQGLNAETLPPPGATGIINTQDKKQKTRDALLKLRNDFNLKPNSKFTLKQARTLDNHTFSGNELTSSDQVLQYIFQTLMINNYHARKFELRSDENTAESGDDSDESGDEDDGINPMDALLAIFYFSDNSLRRYLALKLSACQLSVPFLLPDLEGDSDEITILLSSLEDITKSWNDLSDVFATEYPFPVVSFTRVGKISMSKSSLINQVMGDGSKHDFFFHKNLEGGGIKREIVDGFVELSWYLPGNSEKKSFESEICFMNLRGDAKDFKRQRNILSEISSVLCILLPSEYPDETSKKVLEEAMDNKAKIILIFLEKTKPEAKKYFKEFVGKHSDKISSITRQRKVNEHKFVTIIQEEIEKSVHKIQATPLSNLASLASKYDIHSDDDETYSKVEMNIDKWLKIGIKEAKDLLKLQKHVPKLANLEREIYRPKTKGGKSIAEDTNKIYEDRTREEAGRKETFKHLDPRILECLNSFAKLNASKRDKALRKLKHQLDRMVLRDMAELHAKDQKKNVATLEELDKKRLEQFEEKSKFSFGLEHIVRELAQLHQIKESKYDYAGAAADMLLSGQPLEILDGESFYIPLEWLRAVFTELEKKTKNAKIFVISVLGIQSSGKSTMLNTMFGLEFKVSAGRCTRGAFVSLLPVSNSLKSTSELDYVLIVDSEGLRGSGDPRIREHDNELATFVIGVASLTIVNIMGENHEDMKEFLEMAVHAFLRMKLVKEKKTCKIVYHNVAATDASDKLTAARLNLKKDLDKMTKLAATHENCEEEIQKLDDIMSFNANKDVFYIPNLFEGIPPMAPISPTYGRAIQKVKENIVNSMSSTEDIRLSVSQFREKVCNLWKAMLKENFIFHFRNVIEVRAYAALDRKYFEESVNLMVTGMTELKTEIEVALERCTTREERGEKWKESKTKIWGKAAELGNKMEAAMKLFFETNEDRATLEKWREDIMIKIKQMQDNQKSDVTEHCRGAYRYWQNRQDVDERKQDIENKFLQKARNFITTAENSQETEKCLAAFDKEWKKWMKDVPKCEEKKVDINNEMLDVLNDTTPALNAEMTEKLVKECFWVLNFKGKIPVIRIDESFWKKVSKLPKTVINFFKMQQESEARTIIDRAVDSAVNFAKEKAKSRVRCTRNDLTTMYHKIITTIDESKKQAELKIDKSCKCDILLYAFANAYDIFEEMEQRCLQERDIRGDLERTLRPTLETYFENICKKMGKELLAANSFVVVLRQQIKSKLDRVMGPAVAKKLSKVSKFNSKGQFHASVLIELGEKAVFKSYIPYLEDPIKHLKTRLVGSIENYCINENPACINSILKKEVKKIKKNVSDGIKRAKEKTNKGDKLTVWIQQFVIKCSSLAISIDKFKVAAIDDELKDIDVFQTKVENEINKFFESLIQDGIDSSTMEKWEPPPHDQLLTYMFGCQSLCPFCKGLCDQTLNNHPGSHSTKSHRAQGLTGYRDFKTNILSSFTCTQNVAIEGKKFRNTDTNFEWHLYTKYQSVNDYYKSWSIPPDKSFELSKYWQWFMGKFSKELCEHYEAKEPEIPSTWKNRTFEEVKRDLRQKYNIQLVVDEPTEP